MSASGPSLVVTGLGAVTAAGTGWQAAAGAFATGAPPLGEVDRSAGYHRRAGSRRAFLAGQHSLATWLPVMAARRLCPSSRFAVAAAKMALEEAGLEPGSEALAPTAVILATAYGSAQVTEQLLRQILLEGPEAASPALFTESVANAPAAQVAIACHALGANITVTQRQAGPLVALALAATELTSGRARQVLVGAVDEVNPLLHAVLDRFAALARPAADGSETARPFDLRRSGFLAGEGAAVLLLEREDTAFARGATPLARLVLCASAFDPTAPRVGFGREPTVLASALERRLERAGLTPAAVDRVTSGACGSPTGDRLEARLLRRLWRDRPLPPVLAPKATLGENGAALLTATMLTIGGFPFARTPGFVEPDPALGVSPHLGGPLPAARRVLVSALAVGGSAAWAVLEGIRP